jgi:hypothetical protein
MIKKFENFTNKNIDKDIEEISDILSVFENFIEIEVSYAKQQDSIYCYGNFNESRFTHNIEMGDTGRVSISNTATNLERYWKYGYTGNNVTELVVNRLIDFGYNPRITSYTNKSFYIRVLNYDEDTHYKK